MRNRTVSLLSGFLLLLASCGASGDADTQESPTTTTVLDAIVTDTTPEANEPEPDIEEGSPDPVSFDPQLALFEEQFTDIAAGLHRFERLGTEFTIRIPEATMVQPNELGRVVFTTPSSRGPGDEDLILLRPTHLADPTDPDKNDAEPWAADDMTGWIELADSGILISDRQDVMVGGMPAHRFDVELESGYECGPKACAFFAFNQLAEVWFDPGQYYRVWQVPQGEQLPIVLIAGASSADDGWLDQADGLVDGLAFGPIAPHPISADLVLWEAGLPADVPAGEVTIPIAGGMTFELNEDRFILQREGYAAIYPPDDPAQNDIFIARTTQAGPIDSLMSAVERMEEHPSVEVVQSEQVTVGAFDAVKLVVKGRSAPALSWEDPFAQDAVWFPPANGTLWFIDIGDSSPLLVTSESFGSEDLLDTTNATAELLLSTLTID